MVTVWRGLLLVFREIDVPIAGRRPPKHFVNSLSEDELEQGVTAFQRFPSLVEELTSGAATVATKISELERPLSSITRLGKQTFWPSPDDTRLELDEFLPRGEYDSVFIYWPQNNFATGESIPSGGWGLGMGPSPWSNQATYATVANAPVSAWQTPRIGEVWLHEWLHGVCAHFAACGIAMPEGDADGAERHGYVRSAESGWCDFYRDLMTGGVLEWGGSTGIPLQAWLNNTPTARLA